MLREFRLRALQDPAAPIAFLTSYDEEAARPDEFWIDRAAGAARGEVVTQVLAFRDAAPVGSVTGLLEEPGGPDWAGRPIEVRQVHVVGVFVAPEARGAGLLGRLVEQVVAWGQDRGAERARLYVHTDNARAEAAYRKLGFELTGVTAEVPSGVEREMVRGALRPHR